jgi:hypothetical protein
MAIKISSPISTEISGVFFSCSTKLLLQLIIGLFFYRIAHACHIIPAFFLFMCF